MTDTARERPLQDRARRTRERILEAAAAAFARDGYDGASLNDLVRESGLTKGAFYFHFGSKEELAHATFRFKQEQLVQRTLAESRDQPNAVEELRSVLRIRARAFSSDPSTACILRLGAELGGRAGPDSVFARYQDLTIETFAGIVRRGQREGVMRSDLDPRGAAEAILAAMIGADRLSRILTGGVDLEQRGQDVVDLLVNGLAPAGGGTHDGRSAPARRPERRKQ